MTFSSEPGRTETGEVPEDLKEKERDGGEWEVRSGGPRERCRDGSGVGTG